MHRELRSIDRPFALESQASLYLLTLFIGVCLGLDLWPAIATWLNQAMGLSLPVGTETLNFFGYRIRWAMLAALVGGLRTLYTSLDSLLHGRLGADLALALAVLAALLLNQPLVATEVIFIGLVGECLEAYTIGRTQSSIRKLAETFPPMCLVIRDGQQVMTPLDEVQPGQQVAILPGKRVPVDGVIVEGSSSIDQSNLTGESIPVEKQAGDEVLAGTVNQMGALTVEVKRVSTQTVMGQVIEATAKALQAKGRGERTADRMARYFLPVVLLLSLVTFLVQWWMLRGTGAAIYLAVAPALAVLVVACPCALILATPAATMAALARLARTGTLVKRGLALEKLSEVKRFVFDKTGTLTTGQLSLGAIVPIAEGMNEQELLRWAASAESQSEHPVAEALVLAARKQNLDLWPVSDLQAWPGAGVTARCQDAAILIGTERFLREQGVGLSDTVIAEMAGIAGKGQSALLVARDQQLVGIVGVWDTIRPEAAAVMQELRGLGIELALLSGDHADVVRQVAERLEISDAVGQCLPAEKASRLSQWKQNQAVAMVGDGVNDAPALALADVGLAVSQVSQSNRAGSDIAAEAGDIVLMGDPLRSLPLLVRLSREMVAIIRQNILWFAIGVNVVGIALVGWLMPAWMPEGRQQSPLWAAVYHQIGSLLVLLNSMRLLWFERERSPVLSKFGEWSKQVDGWIERFNLHDFSHELYEHRRKLTLGVLSLALLVYLCTSLTVVPAGSIGMVKRCGKVLDEILQPGLQVHYPWPWDQVTLTEPERIRRVEIGFRRAGAGSDTQVWASAHSDNALSDPDETLLMTADGNLVEVQAVLLYSLADPKRYLLGSADVPGMLRAQAEAALRELVAERRFEELLAANRAAFQTLALTRLSERLGKSSKYLGIQLQSLALEDLHPPREVVKDYYDVTRALAARSQLVTEARIAHEKNISRETVAAARMQAEVEGDMKARVSRAQADRDAFLMLGTALRGRQWMLMSSTAAAAGPIGILTPLWVPIVNYDLCRRLTEYRLVVEAGEQLLSGRPKVVRDPRIKGTMQIIPESLKWRLPSLGDQRMPPNPEMP